jgi:hypothetical protein
LKQSVKIFILLAEQLGLKTELKWVLASAEKKISQENEQIKFVRNCHRHHMGMEEIAKLTDLASYTVLAHKFV